MLLRKKIYQISLAIIFAIGSLFVVNVALAQSVSPQENLIVEFEQTPLFGNEEGNFLPGDSVTRWVKVTNNTSDTKKITTEAINYPKNIVCLILGDDLSCALKIIIKEKNENDIYGGSSGTGEKTLFDFYKNGETYLSDVSGNSSKTFQFIISFPENKGDKWQDTTTEFDIIVGFQGGEGDTAPSTLPQGLTILDESILDDVTEDSAVIAWTTSYLSTSQVVYSTEDEYNAGNSFDLDEANYGYSRATTEKDNILPINKVGHGVTGHNVFIDGLSLGTTYHYRCISHASPPTISRTHTFTTLALAKTDEINEPLNNSSENVYSENKPAAKSAVSGEQNFLNNNTSNSKNQINSEITDESQNSSKHYTIAFFVILLFIILAVLFYFFRKRQKKD